MVHRGASPLAGMFAVLCLCHLGHAALEPSTISPSTVAPSLAPSPQTLYPLLPGLPPGYRPFSGLKKGPAKGPAKGKAKALSNPQPPISLPSGPATSQQIRPEDKSKLSDDQILQLLTDKNEKPLPTDSQDAILALFDQTSFRSWNIEMTPVDIEALNANPTLDVSYPCSVTSGYGTPHAMTHSSPSMGCHYRGSVGSLRMCLDEFHKPNHDCRKLSWGVSVDAIKGVKPETPITIHGAESLNFGGCPVDWSLMSERMAFALLNVVNVTASKAVHAKLFLNGKFLGVYSFLQPIDRIFTKQHFSFDKNQGKGALYKELWFNKLGMQKLSAHGKAKEDQFMKKVMRAIDTTPLTQEAATKTLNQYFDIQSFVDVTAFNSAIGNTDDWRQRHNFYWYVKQENLEKKLVLLPWDYDRLYDSAALTRGALAGNPWWDFKRATPAQCNIPLRTPEELAQQMSTTPGELGFWLSIFRELPPDLEIPVSCDKITKLLALGLGQKVRTRTLELLDVISLEQIREWFGVWNQQIGTALQFDPDGPSAEYLMAEQARLLSHLVEARALAVSQASQFNVNKTA